MDSVVIMRGLLGFVAELRGVPGEARVLAVEECKREGGWEDLKRSSIDMSEGNPEPMSLSPIRVEESPDTR